MQFYTNVGTVVILFTEFADCVCLILQKVASTWTSQSIRLSLQLTSSLAPKNLLCYVL